MRPAVWLTFSLAAPLLQAQGAPTVPRTAWVLALDDKGGMPDDLKAEEWKVQVAGKDVVVKGVESPRVTGNLPQNWALVFEPILDPKFRANAIQAAAQFLLNLTEGDRVIVIARTKAGLVPFTPGLTLDRAAWVKGLEKLPGALSSSFEGTNGAMDASLLEIKELGAPTTRLSKEAFFAALQGFLGTLPNAIKESAYSQADPKGVKPLDKLGFDSQSSVRARLQVISLEMKSLERVISSLGKLAGPNHVVVFSRNDADDFTHPGVKGAMSQKFSRSAGDEGGPAESAGLAFRDMSLNQDSIRKASIAAGVTLYSVAGNALNYKGNLGSVAESTGGFAFFFDQQLPVRFGEGLLAFGSRYRLTWEEPKEISTLGFQELTIKSTRPGMKLVHPTKR